LDRDRTVIRPRGWRLVGTRYRTRQSQDLRHDPPDDKTLVPACAYEQHSGNHPCQHGCGLACKLSLCAGKPPRRSKRPSVSFTPFLVTSTFPLVAYPLLAPIGPLSPIPLRLSPPRRARLTSGLFCQCRRCVVAKALVGCSDVSN
jgi:hypothetical protein